jgi:hypothetical protein
MAGTDTNVTFDASGRSLNDCSPQKDNYQFNDTQKRKERKTTHWPTPLIWRPAYSKNTPRQPDLASFGIKQGRAAPAGEGVCWPEGGGWGKDERFW